MTITMRDKPRRVGGAEAREHRSADGSLTVTTPAGQLVQMNSTAMALWELCDGDTQVSEIVAAAAGFFRASQTTIEHDVVSALGLLADQGLIER